MIPAPGSCIGAEVYKKNEVSAYCIHQTYHFYVFQNIYLCLQSEMDFLIYLYYKTIKIDSLYKKAQDFVKTSQDFNQIKLIYDFFLDSETAVSLLSSRDRMWQCSFLYHLKQEPLCNDGLSTAQKIVDIIRRRLSYHFEITECRINDFDSIFFINTFVDWVQ